MNKWKPDNDQAVRTESEHSAHVVLPYAPRLMCHLMVRRIKAKTTPPNGSTVPTILPSVNPTWSPHNIWKCERSKMGQEEILSGASSTYDGTTFIGIRLSLLLTMGTMQLHNTLSTFDFSPKINCSRSTTELWECDLGDSKLDLELLDGTEMAVFLSATIAFCGTLVASWHRA